MYVDELGDTSLVVFRLDGKDSRMSTIVVRGATDNYMDDIERAIDDGVNTFKGVTRVCNDKHVILCKVSHLKFPHRMEDCCLELEPLKWNLPIK